eukprot:scpid111473/ scgid7426/ 
MTSFSATRVRAVVPVSFLESYRRHIVVWWGVEPRTAFQQIMSTSTSQEVLAARHNKCQNTHTQILYCFLVLPTGILLLMEMAAFNCWLRTVFEGKVERLTVPSHRK